MINHSCSKENLRFEIFIKKRQLSAVFVVFVNAIQMKTEMDKDDQVFDFARNRPRWVVSV